MAYKLIEDLEKAQPVIVKWYDHYCMNVGWVGKSQIEQAEPAVMHQCGYYIGEDDMHLVIAGCVDASGGVVGSPYFILKSDIIEWYDLKDPFKK